MKIKINIDAIEPQIDSLVKSELEMLNLPSCFGNMIPSVLKRVVEFEDSEVLTPKNTVLIDEIGIDDASSVVVDGKRLKDSFVLTKETVAILQEYKKQRALAYAHKIAKCKDCKHAEICNHLTVNYLKLIELEERV